MAERARIFDQIEHRRYMHESVEEIAADLRISTSSIYRWQRSREEDQRTLGIRRTISLDEAVSRLCTSSEDLSFELIEAIFYFNAWLRWPTEPQVHYFAVTAQMFQYISQKCGVQNVADLNKCLKESLIKFINLRAIAELCGGSFNSYANFDLHNIMDQPYTDLDAAGDLAWFLLARRGRNPKFLDAYDAMIKGVDKYKFEMSEGSFRKFWRNMLPSCAFLYVERYHCSLAWTSDPFSSHFIEEVDEIIKNANERRRYFSLAFSAFNLVRARTDRRSWTSCAIPTYPQDLEKHALEIKPLLIAKRQKAWIKIAK